MSHNMAGTGGGLALGTLGRSCPLLTVLGLEDAGLNTKGGAGLLNGLCDGPALCNLARIDLSDNHFTAVVSQPLVRLLRSGKVPGLIKLAVRLHPLWVPSVLHAVLGTFEDPAVCPHFAVFDASGVGMYATVPPVVALARPHLKAYFT